MSTFIFLKKKKKSQQKFNYNFGKGYLSNTKQGSIWNFVVLVCMFLMSIKNIITQGKVHFEINIGKSFILQKVF